MRAPCNSQQENAEEEPEPDGRGPPDHPPRRFGLGEHDPMVS